ncbi:putative patatin-like phospholipase domain, Acyl transferase/acyl hydrolase/lysophospholipase [Dioscorea sansibarensis]
MAALMEPTWDVDKLSYEIFSILESKFLFSPSPPTTPAKPPKAGRVRILSIDATGDAILAAACLSRLEASLRKRSGITSARISDFFDLAAGSGAGGFLAALLFTPRPGGAPPLSAEDALRLLSKTRGKISGRRGVLAGIFRRSAGGVFKRVFGDATIRDSVKPVLIPCYDLNTGAVLMFSRADATEAVGFDFRVRDVCTATCAGWGKRVAVKSVDGTTRIEAIGGAVAMVNPAAAAVTHVLNNGIEFPLANGVEDLLVISIGGVEVGNGFSGVVAPPSPGELVEIAGKGDADMIDQSLAMAFGHCRTSNYVRIQANNLLSPTKVQKSKGIGKSNETENLMKMAEEVLNQRNIESILFRGRKVSDQTNAEKLDFFSQELFKEHQRRMKNNTDPSSLLTRPSSATTSITSP